MSNGRITWRPIHGSPDFVDDAGVRVAVYKRTVRGRAEYHTFPLSLAKSLRTEQRALSIGGLPEFSTQMRGA